MTQKIELGPLMPGMVLQLGKRGDYFTILDNGWIQIGPAKFSQAEIEGTSMGREYWQPIPITPEILRDMLGFLNNLHAGNLPFEGIQPDEYWYKPGTGFGCIFHNHKGKTWVQTNIGSNEGCSPHPGYAHEFQRLLAGLGLDHAAKLP